MAVDLWTLSTSFSCNSQHIDFFVFFTENKVNQLFSNGSNEMSFLLKNNKTKLRMSPGTVLLGSLMENEILTGHFALFTEVHNIPD